MGALGSEVDDRLRHYGGPALGVSKGLALPAQSAG